jgi:hypothetical protein
MRPSRSALTFASGNRKPVDLSNVKSLLSKGYVESALQVFDDTDDEPPEVKNAHAVCLLRLGKTESAMKLLRQLVFPNHVLAIDSDIPDTYKVNFATAVLMEGNIDGCLHALDTLGVSKHPTAEKLRAALVRWHKGLSFGQRFKLTMGYQPNAPIELGFPPGEL